MSKAWGVWPWGVAPEGTEAGCGVGLVVVAVVGSTSPFFGCDSILSSTTSPALMVTSDSGAGRPLWMTWVRVSVCRWVLTATTRPWYHPSPPRTSTDT